MVKKSLIDRVGEIQNLEDLTTSVCNALSVPRKWNIGHIFQVEMVNEILPVMENKNFRHSLYSINTDVLKRVYFGFLSTGELPKEFLGRLTDWEKVYFLRGRWSEKNPDLSEPLLILTSRHLYLGLNDLHRDYYIMKAKGKYKSGRKFPESDSVREDYWKIIRNYQNKIKEPEPVQLGLFS